MSKFKKLITLIVSKMSQDYKSIISNKFKKLFKTSALLIASPGRINLIGEHVDYSDGFVFPAAIDKYIFTAIGKSTRDTCTIYSEDKIESFSFSLKSIKPLENGGWRNYILGVIAGIQEKGLDIQPFNAVFGGNIPSGSGLSSSAALENSFVFGFNKLFQLGLSKEEMILISQKAEHNYVGVKCGIMDQYASMFGKKGHLLHLDCRSIRSQPYFVDLKDYEIVLLNTNVKHNLADSEYNNRRKVTQDVSGMLNMKALRDASIEDLDGIKTQLSKEDYQKALFVIEEIERTQKAGTALKNNDVIALGQLLYASHNGLQDQFKVSCKELDYLVDIAKKDANVVGARMMGGGFGGCTINLVKKNASQKFIEFASKKYQQEFQKECTVVKVEISEGTHIIN